jgi:hypothetical protein
MTSHPISFRPELVLAILENRKTVTRRIMQKQPLEPPTVGLYNPIRVKKSGEEYPAPEVFGAWCDGWDLPCQYGAPGDGLRVKGTRLSLEILAISAERIQDITDSEAVKEGVASRDEFEALWRKINGDESWESNPWVWRIEFKKVTGN